MHTRDACAYALCWWLLGNKTSLSNRDWPASILVPADRVNTRGTNDPVATWRGQGLPRPSQGSFVSSRCTTMKQKLSNLSKPDRRRTNVSKQIFLTIWKRMLDEKIVLSQIFVIFSVFRHILNFRKYRGTKWRMESEMERFKSGAKNREFAVSSICRFDFDLLRESTVAFTIVKICHL